MRKLLLTALLPLCTLLSTTLVSSAQDEFEDEGASAQEDPNAPAGPKPFLAQALLVMERKQFQYIWIIAATKSEIRYLEGPNSIDPIDMRIAKAKSIYLIEPKEFAQALDLFQARKYAEAKPKFAAIKARHKSMESMPGNHSALAEFYELECMRKLGDLEGLANAMKGFIKDPLTRENQLRQVDAYVFWDAVRTKSWARIDALAKERATEHLPNFIRAQIGYCHGLALEALGKPGPALNAYNTAMVADSGASEELTRQACLNVLRIHKANPAVQLAIKLWRTPDENKNAQGYYRLLEASSMAKFYEFMLGDGTPLPAEYKELLKYQEDDKAAPAKEPAPKPEKAQDEEKSADGDKAADEEK